MTATSDLPYRRKVAVVIGISDYRQFPQSTAVASGNPGPYDLLFGEKDGHDFIALLQSGRLGKGWEVYDFMGTKAKRRDLMVLLNSLSSDLTSDDLVFFFFSGHGFSELNDPEKTYLFLYDSHLNNMPTTALSLRTLREWVLALNAKHVVLFLDACRSGLLGVAKGQTEFSYGALEATQFSQRPGKVAITSSIGSDLSYEWPLRQNSFFTSLLISALKEEIARPTTGTYLTIKDVYSALVRELPLVTARSRDARRQIPGLIQLDGGEILDFPIALAK
jgi:hypothetical protein